MPTSIQTVKVSGQTYNLNILSMEELIALTVELKPQIADIEAQINEARQRLNSDGIRADEDWWARVNQAFRIKTRLLEEINHQIRMVCAKRLPQIFLELAQKYLDQETYDDLLEKAIEETRLRHNA